MKIISTVAAIFVLGPVALMLLLVGAGIGKRDASARDDPPPAVERRVVPTAAPQPTPRPVQAAKPAAITKPGLSPEERAYVAYMGEWSQALGRGLEGLGASSGEVGQRPALLTDAAWRIRTAAALGLIDTSAEKMQTYQPVPPRLARLNNLMVAAGQNFRIAVRLYTGGIDNADADQLRVALASLNQATAVMQEANAELKTVASG